MNFYKTSFFLLLLSLPLLALNCGKKEPEPVYYLPQEFQDYVVFPVGSYWVYSSSIGLDSVILFNGNIQIINNDKDVGFPYEKLVQKFSSSFFLDSLYGGTSRIYLPQGITAYSEFFKSNFLAGNTLFFYGKDTGHVLHYNEEIWTVYSNFYDSLQVGGLWYKEVREFYMQPEMDVRLPKKIWYARNVGVIKKELYNGQIWELKEYHIQ